jgi:integrase
MPRLTQQNPSYRKHRSSGQAVVTLNGQDVYLGPFGTAASKREYDRVISEWLARGRQSSNSSSPFIAEICLAFLKAHATHYRRKDGTDTGELRNFKTAIKPLVKLYGRTAADEFGPLALEAVRNEMIRMVWGRKSINRQVSRVRQVFSWAVSRELIPGQVHSDLCTLKGLQANRTDARETEPVKPVPHAYVDATLDFLPPAVETMVKLQLATGMRSTELCTMRHCDIDTSGQVWSYRPSQHKTLHHSIDRVIDLGPKAQALIGPYLKSDVTAFLFSPAQADRERREARTAARKTPLSCGNRTGSNIKAKPKKTPGDRFTKDTYARAIAYASERADLWAKGGVVIGDEERLVPHWHPHQLRHNFATDVRKHFGAEAVLAAIGDKSTSMIDLYAEKDRAVAMKIAEAIG